MQEGAEPGNLLLHATGKSDKKTYLFAPAKPELCLAACFQELIITSLKTLESN
jgi:hypothetical protein